MSAILNTTPGQFRTSLFHLWPVPACSGSGAILNLKSEKFVFQASLCVSTR